MNKLQCPNCHSYKIRSSKLIAIVLIIVGLSTLIILIGIAIFLAGMIMLLLKTEYTCESCGYRWRGKLPAQTGQSSNEPPFHKMKTSG